MSDKPKHDETHGATTIRASKGGGGKLLLGVVAAAVLLGGGYLAWKNYGATNGAQTAYNDSYNSQNYADDPLRAGPTDSNDTAIADTASTEATPPPATSPRSASTPARRQTASTRSNAVPEQTIGITPIGATTYETASEGEDIVVTGVQRPIWVRTPSANRLSAMYPDRARARGREGEARLHCTVQANGSLDCARVEETPGFGPAALRVANTLRHAPQLADGSSATGSPVNLRVVFRMDDNQRG